MCTNGAADISLKADVKGPFLQVFESFQFRPEFYFAVELQSRNASPQGARPLDPGFHRVSHLVRPLGHFFRIGKNLDIEVTTEVPFPGSTGNSYLSLWKSTILRLLFVIV